jgi:integrase
MKHVDGAGSLRLRRGKWEWRVSLGALGRRSLWLRSCTTSGEAEARRGALTGPVGKLIAAHREAVGLPLLERAAAAEGKTFRAALALLEDVARGDAAVRPGNATTIHELGERWTSGELARLHPDHIRPKRSAEDDKERLALYVYPIAGDIPIAAFTLDHAERIMRQLPAQLAKATRRHVAQVVHRLLAIAVFPLRLIAASPLPKGWLPRIGPAKAKAYLYPDEERRLLALRAAPLAVRMLYGFLAREGMRSWSEAARLEWSDIDLERGAVTLDTNKTDDPRAWALRPDVVRALRIWRKMRPAGQPLVFGADVDEPKPAELFRERLRAAGVERAQLFERNAERLWIRVHDLRATFITLGLANGRTEAWISDRTGHKSSIMINRYRRAARTAAELGLGDLAPLDLAVPELASPKGAKGDTAERSNLGTARPTKPRRAPHRRSS